MTQPLAKGITRGILVLLVLGPIAKVLLTVAVVAALILAVKLVWGITAR
jgi:cell division protein FtsL